MFNMNEEVNTRRRGGCLRSPRAEEEVEVLISILDLADLIKGLSSSSAKRILEDAVDVPESA